MFYIINRMSELTSDSDASIEMQNVNCKINAFVKEELTLLERFDELKLSANNKKYVRYRLIPSLALMRRRALCTTTTYYALYTVMNLGSVALPALLSLQTAGAVDMEHTTWASFTMSLVIGAATVLAGRFDLAKQFYQCKKTLAKFEADIEMFLACMGRYAKRSHQASFALFAKRAENYVAKAESTIISQAAKKEQDAQKVV